MDIGVYIIFHKLVPEYYTKIYLPNKYKDISNPAYKERGNEKKKKKIYKEVKRERER